MFKKIFGQIYIWLILLLIYLPVLILVVYSFTESTNLGTWSGFSFNLYAALFQNEQILKALGNTIIIAITSALVATIIGTLGAIGVYSLKARTRKLVNGLNNIPIANPEIVVALSLTTFFVFLTTFVFKESLLSFWTILIGHVCLSLPFVFTSVIPKLKQMDPSLYEAALDLGATPRQALRKVIIPEVMPGVISGFLISLTLSLDDFIVTRFVRGPGLLSGESQIETLSTLVQAKIKKGPIPRELRPLTTILFLLIIFFVVGNSIYRNIKEKRRLGK